MSIFISVKSAAYSKRMQHYSSWRILLPKKLWKTVIVPKNENQCEVVLLHFSEFKRLS